MWDSVIKLFSGGAGDLLKGVKDLINEFHVSPEQAQTFALKAQELEEAYQLKLIEAHGELDRLDAADRKNARDREMVIKDKTPTILAYAITGGFFGVLVMMAYTDIPLGAKEVLYVMIGSLGTAWTGVISYYYGSSSGSAAKQVTIDRLAK